MTTPPYAVELDPATGRLTVSGDLEDAALVSLRSVLAQTSDEGIDELTIDLSQVTFLPSAAVSELATSRVTWTSQGRRLVLHSDPGTIARRILEITALLPSD